MADITSKNKWIFWAMITAVFLFATVPSLVFLKKTREYGRFLSGWNPGTLKQLKVRRLPPPRDSIAHGPEIRFVEFSIAAPSAGQVRLLGTFNRWDRETLPMYRREGGGWEVVVPLPPGQYPYVFEVDGTWTPDPKSSKKSRWAEKEVSVRKVQ